MTPDNQLPSPLGREVRAHIGIEEYRGKKRNVIRYYLEPVPDLLAKLLLASWEAWLSDNPCPPDEPGAPTINLWIPRAASACLFRKLPPNWSADLIRRAMTRREKSPREVERTVERVYGGKVSGAGTPRSLKAKQFDPERMRKAASRVPNEITYDLLAELSPVDVRGVTPSDFLNYIFNAGEFVPIKNRDNDYGFPYRVGDPDSARKLEKRIHENQNGVWFHTCPTNGKYNIIREEKDGDVTYRQGACYADKLITHWRYLLLESDKQGFEQEWLRIIVRLRQRIVALYTSGNVSVHALLRIDAKSKEEFTKIADRFKRLVPFGVCGGSLTATRATRLPGVVRRDNGNTQLVAISKPETVGEADLEKGNPSREPTDSGKEGIRWKQLSGMTIKLSNIEPSVVNFRHFRGVMDGLVPFFQFRANRPRSGKDYLAQISHIIYAGEQLEDAALPEYDSKGYEKSEETRKRITTLFHQGRRFAHFANCAGYVEDKYFIQAITAPVWSDRKLGQNALLQFRNEMQFSLSGNMDLSLKPDLEPRSRCVTLAYFDEDENSRTFRTPDLHGWIKDNRRLVLSAIHAVFRTWVDAGMPAGKTPFTSFPKWAKVVGGAMAAAGLGDPCLPHPSSIKRKDPGLAAMSALFEHCHEADVNNGDEQGSWWTLQELYSEIEQFWAGVEAIDEFGWFKDLYSDHDGRLNRRSIGVLIRNWKGRTTGGLKMELDDHDSKSTRHRVRFKPVTK